ncbi:MAG: DUF4446 family protein [Clostridiaceae bacterium]|nr:DUF4446 family protein [Clostridiaceae bacterium]
MGYNYIYYFAGLIAFLMILIIIAFFRLGSLSKKYKRLIKGLSKNNVEDLMTSYSDELFKVKNEIDGNIKTRLSILERQMPTCLRHFGIVSYNAFENVSNNMSFSFAALNDNCDGIVITGIYTRDNSYVYSKEIVNGESVKVLSKEEKEALKKAFDSININKNMCSTYKREEKLYAGYSKNKK